MTRSPDSLIPSDAEQFAAEKRDDKAFTCRQEGKANLWAAIEVNADSASITPPVRRSTQLELFPGRACVPKAKPATSRSARMEPSRQDGVLGGSTQRQDIQLTGETCSVRWRKLRPVEKRIRVKPESAAPKPGRESEAATVPKNFGKTEGREGRCFHQANETGKAAGLPPQGKASSRRRRRSAKRPCD
jgi:hypothetical protein